MNPENIKWNPTYLITGHARQAASSPTPFKRGGIGRQPAVSSSCKLLWIMFRHHAGGAISGTKPKRDEFEGTTGPEV